MKSNIIRRYPLTLLLVTAIWVVCMIPVPETPLDDVQFIDKWTHFVMYGTLTAVIWAEYARCHAKVVWSRLLLFGIVAPVVMGCAVEVVQAYLTTSRSGDPLDALCNALGVLLGAALGVALLGIKAYRNRNHRR